jgi:hypothetical protein
MKNVFLLIAILLLTFTSLANAKDCSVLLGKTYIPRGPGRSICDGNNLPAEFANNLNQLSSELAKLGYKVTTFDQCAKSAVNETEKYVIGSQLGDCQQMGFYMTCSLLVRFIDAAKHEIVYTNTVTKTGFGSVTIELGEVLANLPACENL